MKTTSTTQPTETIYTRIEALTTDAEIAAFDITTARTINKLFLALSKYYPDAPASDLLAHIITGLNMLASL